jgi:hypothetical protein
VRPEKPGRRPGRCLRSPPGRPGRAETLVAAPAPARGGAEQTAPGNPRGCARSRGVTRSEASRAGTGTRRRLGTAAARTLGWRSLRRRRKQRSRPWPGQGARDRRPGAGGARARLPGTRPGAGPWRGCGWQRPWAASRARAAARGATGPCPTSECGGARGGGRRGSLSPRHAQAARGDTRSAA